MEHVDMKGIRPLDRAVSCGHLEAVRCFLKKGAKLGPTTWSLAENRPMVMLTLLNKLLEDGNTLFRKNKLEEAAVRYQYAAKRVPSQPGHQPVFDKLRIHLLLNLARVRRKLCDVEVGIVEMVVMVVILFSVYFRRPSGWSPGSWSSNQTAARRWWPEPSVINSPGTSRPH